MKRIRSILALLALLILPGVLAAQGRRQSERICSPDQQAAVDRALAAGRAIPPGLAHCAPSAPEPPPSGVHKIKGNVYEDVDGSGSWEMTAGEFGLQGWTVQLYWKGQLVSSATSDANGYYEFPNLGNSAEWGVCVVDQAGWTRTEPVAGDLCGGAGKTLPISNTFETHVVQNFGMMMAQ